MDKIFKSTILRIYRMIEEFREVTPTPLWLFQLELTQTPWLWKSSKSNKDANLREALSSSSSLERIYTQTVILLLQNLYQVELIWKFKLSNMLSNLQISHLKLRLALLPSFISIDLLYLCSSHACLQRTAAKLPRLTRVTWLYLTLMLK